MPNQNLPILHLLASAQATDLYGPQGVDVLIGFAAAAGAALLAILPVALASSRRHRQSHSILAATVVWALVTAGSVGYVVISRLHWSREWMLRVNTGYYDPQDLSGQPTWPWVFWTGLALVYGLLCLWSSRRNSDSMPKAQ